MPIHGRLDVMSGRKEEIRDNVQGISLEGRQMGLASIKGVWHLVIVIGVL